MGKRKIHILHATLHLNMGGLEAVIMDLCRQGDKDRFRYFVLCFNSCDPAYRKELEILGVKVFFIQRQGRYDIAFFLKIISLLRKMNIQILHAHSGCVFNALLCGFLAGVPMRMFTEHGLPFFADGTPMPVSYKTKIEEFIIGKLSKKIVGVSLEIEGNLKQRFSRFLEKVCMVPNGIDTSKFTNSLLPEELVELKRKYSVPPDKFILGSVGRLVPIKNYPCLLKAFALLQKNLAKKNKAHIVLVGDGGERGSLEDLARKLGIIDNISFLGQQYEINKILPIFDVFVLPSLTEGTSISLLEAQSCAVPAIVTDVGGNPNIIQDKENGFLFAVNDSKFLARKIGDLLDDKTFAAKMGECARHKILREFAVCTMVQVYNKMYLETLSW